MPKIKLHASLHNESLTIASCITVVRFFLIPPLVWCLIRENTTAAALIFVLAVVTDLIDGTVARMLKQETVLGGCLDRLADKCMVIALVSTGLYTQWNSLRPPVWFVVTVLVREVGILLGVLVVFLVKGIVEVQQPFMNKVYSNCVYGLIAVTFSWLLPEPMHTLLVLAVAAMVVGSILHHLLLGLKALTMEVL